MNLLSPKIWLLVFLIVTWVNSSTTAQVSQENFEELSEEINYDETHRVLKLKEKPKEEEEEEIDMEIPTGVIGSLGGLLNGLTYLIIAILVISVLVFIFSNVKIQEKLDLEIPEAEQRLNEHIDDIDVETELEEAVRNGNYRLATRIQFIGILKFLNDGKKIDWRLEKTNRAYLRELRSSQFENDFANLSRIYEFVWYGNRQIDHTYYEALEKNFASFYNIGR